MQASCVSQMLFSVSRFKATTTTSHPQPSIISPNWNPSLNSLHAPLQSLSMSICPYACVLAWNTIPPSVGSAFLSRNWWGCITQFNNELMSMNFDHWKEKMGWIWANKISSFSPFWWSTTRSLLAAFQRSLNVELIHLPSNILYLLAVNHKQ